MHRQRRLSKPSRSWNILFYTDLIEAIQRKADEISVTPSQLVRTAVANYLDKTPHTDQGNDFMDGVKAATDMVREDIRAPRFPSGHTLGDRIADKILDKFKSQ